MIEGKQKKYIVYADDDTEDRDMLIEALQVLDPSLHFATFENGLEVMQHLASIGRYDELPQGIILDINMPIWDGLRTLRALKDDPRLGMIPVCVLTNSSAPRDAAVSEELGAKAFFTKPVSDAALAVIATQMIRFWK
jgi:CheY-like chemotaxis protein